MRILFAGHKERGVACLDALLRAGHVVVGVLAHPPAPDGPPVASLSAAARRHGLPLWEPVDASAPALLEALHPLRPDLTVLAGFGQIVRPPFIELARHGCINLHAGKLPQYRGSSPLNWALINGEREFTLSIIRVDAGVDTGPVLAEARFPIGIDDTIADLQRVATDAFPRLLLEVVGAIARGTVPARVQDETQATYWPLRFPDDGFVLWDLLTATQVHNRIRALTSPYPCAFTFWKGQRIGLLASALGDGRHRGEPGRVYRTTGDGLLVAARDRCLWVRRAVLTASGLDARTVVARYDRFATVTGLALSRLTGTAEAREPAGSTAPDAAGGGTPPGAWTPTALAVSVVPGGATR
jgi:methionyl-tRNA formyltransferase